jgi:hypothetical protein
MVIIILYHQLLQLRQPLPTLVLLQQGELNFVETLKLMLASEQEHNKQNQKIINDLCLELGQLRERNKILNNMIEKQENGCIFLGKDTTNGQEVNVFIPTSVYIPQ